MVLTDFRSRVRVHVLKYLNGGGARVEDELHEVGVLEDKDLEKWRKMSDFGFISGVTKRHQVFCRCALLSGPMAGSAFLSILRSNFEKNKLP